MLESTELSKKKESFERGEMDAICKIAEDHRLIEYKRALFNSANYSSTPPKIFSYSSTPSKKNLTPLPPEIFYPDHA